MLNIQLNNNPAYLYPVFAMLMWVTVVMLWMVSRRISAMKTHAVPKDHFEAFNSEQPKSLITAERNIRNLFEMPVFFYAVCVAAYASNFLSVSFVALSWAYVLLRMAHSVVHLTVNIVNLRFGLFLISNLVLAALWILFLLH